MHVYAHVGTRVLGGLGSYSSHDCTHIYMYLHIDIIIMSVVQSSSVTMMPATLKDTQEIHVELPIQNRPNSLLQ